jgi:hypothetical protein
MNQKALDLSNTIRNIASRSPPQRPTKLQISKFDFQTDAERQWRLQAADEEYSRKLREYNKELQRYQQDLDQLPIYREQLRQVQYEANHAQLEIAAVRQNIIAKLPEFDHQFNAARGRDIVQRVADMRELGARDIGEPTTLVLGLTRLLTAQLLLTLARPWLDASLRDAEEIARDVKNKIESAIRENHRTIGFDVLKRCVLIFGALRHNEDELLQISHILNSLPITELAQLTSELLNLAHQSVFPPVPAYHQLVDPEALVARSAELAGVREQILAAQTAAQQSLDQTASVLAQANDARTRAGSHRSAIDAVARQLETHLTEIEILWKLLFDAQRNALVGEHAKMFIIAVHLDADRRTAHPIIDVIERCDRTSFLLKDADREISTHVSAWFDETRQDLAAALAGLESREREYRAAVVDIEKVPERVVEKYRKRWRLYVFAGVVPVLNLLCSTLLAVDLAKLKTAVQSRAQLHEVWLSPYRELPPLASLICTRFLVVSAAVMVLMGGLLVYLTHKVSGLPTRLSEAGWAAVSTYSVTLLLSVWNVFRVRSYRQSG